MTLLVIEPRFDGHHFTYLEKVVEGAILRRMHVIVGTGNDLQGKKIRAGLDARFGEQVQYVSARMPKPPAVRPAVFNIALAEVRYRRFLRMVFRAAARLAPVDRVFVPLMDSCLFAISLFGSPFGRVRFSGITMRQRFHFPARGITAASGSFPRIRERLFRRLLKLSTLERIFTIDETLVEHFEAEPSCGSAKVIHFPDPSDPPAGITQSQARIQLGLPEDACVLLVYGFVDRRKGIPRLLDWVCTEPALTRAHLLVAGRQGDDVSELFDAAPVQAVRNQGRLHVFNRFIAPEDESMLFAAADLVWLAYDDFELMSSVLVKAAMHRRGIVFLDRGLIARYARRYGREYRDADNPGCVVPLRALPSELMVRHFRRGAADPPLPDHSWTNALRLIHE